MASAADVAEVLSLGLFNVRVGETMYGKPAGRSSTVFSCTLERCSRGAAANGGHSLNGHVPPNGHTTPRGHVASGQPAEGGSYGASGGGSARGAVSIARLTLVDLAGSERANPVPASPRVAQQGGRGKVRPVFYDVVLSVMPDVSIFFCSFVCAFVAVRDLCPWEPATPQALMLSKGQFLQAYCSSDG